MDRDDLMTLLGELDNGTLTVGLDGDLWSDDNQWTVADVEERVAALEESLAELRKVLAWAKLAPRYKGTHTNEDGKLCDANGIPL